MRLLEKTEVNFISGGEAGVPHSDYYYGDSTSGGFWNDFTNSLLDLVCRGGRRC
jgi:hypothetical protein